MTAEESPKDQPRHLGAPLRRPAGSYKNAHHQWLQTTLASGQATPSQVGSIPPQSGGAAVIHHLPDPIALLAGEDNPVVVAAGTPPPLSRILPVERTQGPDLKVMPTALPDQGHRGRLNRSDILGVVKHSESAPGQPWLRELVERGLTRMRRKDPTPIPSEIGDMMLGLLPAPVIAVTSRKGGVGKTAIAAALAQVLGYAVSETSGTAAIVDQNIGNADQWGRLDVAENAYTVRDLMTALEAGWNLPAAPTWASTPALAVYPESRQAAEGYPPGLIKRFSGHLRDRHVATVVDLPNRLPAYTSAEAAICAGWVEVADLVLLPTTDDPNALTGVLDYLAAPSLEGKSVLVPYIVSNLRDVRENPRVLEMLQMIARRVRGVIHIPKSEQATLAIVQGRPILDAAPELRDAYLNLGLTVVRTLVADRKRDRGIR